MNAVWPPSLASRRGMWQLKQSESFAGCAAGNSASVASETFATGNRQPVGRRFCVWVVAGAAPQAALAVARARAQGELFHVADHLEIASGSSRRCGIVVDRECVFKRLARDKIAQLFAGIRHAARAKQVALFADAVARGRRQLCGIHDIAGAWIGKVAFCRTVAPFTGDRFRGRKSAVGRNSASPKCGALCRSGKAGTLRRRVA